MKFLTISKQLFLFSSCALFWSLLANAQVGVNTTTPAASSVLDITSSDKGFLMTKVALTGTDDITTITPAPSTGLLVFNTATNGSPGTEVVQGFYYFNGTSWRRFYNQGFTLSYEQADEVLASTSNTTFRILPGLDTGEITVPFSGTYQIRVEAYYAAGNLVNAGSDGAAQGAISLAMFSSGVSGGGSSCSGGITNFPYNESFESGLGAWTQSTADNINWTRRSGSTPSGGTGPTSANDGSFYMYTEATNNFNRQAILNSPCFNLTTSPAASINFDYHMRGSNTGTINLEVSDDDGVSWTSIWNENGDQGTNWLSESVDLSDYIGGSVQLRFNATTGPGFRSDIAIDNIEVNETAGTFMGGGNVDLTTIKETYLTTSSKRLGNTSVNNLAQSGSILVNIDLNAGTTYRFAVRGREWLTNNASSSTFGKNTSGYAGNSINDAQRGTMTISLIKQF